MIFVAKVLIKARIKNELCKKNRLYSNNGLECNLDITAMTPAKDIKSKIKDALGLKNISNITIEIEKVVILGARKEKDWDFEDDNDNLGMLFRRFHNATSTNLCLEEDGPLTPEKELNGGIKHAEYMLNYGSPCLRFEIKFN